MDSFASRSELSCERALALAGDWIDGRVAADERKSIGAHLAACPACDAQLRARMAARGSVLVDAPIDERIGEPNGAPIARGFLATGARRLGRFRGALLFFAVGAVLFASFERSRRASRLVEAAHASLADGASARAGDELVEGAIVLVATGGHATLARGSLRLSVEGPARVRATARGFDLLSGAGRVEGDGVIGTSRGALDCDAAVVDLVESAEGFELRCADGAARLVAHETHHLRPGARLGFARASLVPTR